MINKILLVTLFLLVPAASVFSQNESDSTGNHHWSWEKFKREMNLFKQDMNEVPTVSLSYGISNIYRKDIASKFANPGLIELKLGYTTEKEKSFLSHIIRYNFNYLYLDNFDNSLSFNSSSGTDKIRTNMWRFGVGFSSGYGYRLGTSGAAIIPYFTTGLDWSRAHFKDAPLNQSDYEILNMYHNKFKFGTSAESGIRINFSKFIALDASYQRSIVFQKHLFWKWAGSAMIELVGQGLLEEFLGSIADSSPNIAPIVSIILKSGLAYGLYELRLDKMNWPFNSEPPLSFDQVKVGLTFNF